MNRLHAYPKLSPRQLEFYDLLVSETHVKHIANALGVTVRGVKFQAGCIYSATKVTSRYQLIVKHYQNEIARLAA